MSCDIDDSASKGDNYWVLIRHSCGKLVKCDPSLLLVKLFIAPEDAGPPKIKCKSVVEPYANNSLWCLLFQTPTQCTHLRRGLKKASNSAVGALHRFEVPTDPHNEPSRHADERPSAQETFDNYSGVLR